MPVGAAVVVGAVVTAGAGAYSANKAKEASDDALRAQMEQQAKVEKAASPYLKTGEDALGVINDRNRLVSEFTTDPGYQFRLNEGIAAVNQNKAVAGLIRSGSNVKDTMKYGQGLASDEFSNYYNRLLSRVNIGTTGLNAVAGVANNNSQFIGQNSANQANAALASSAAIQQGAGMVTNYAAGLNYGGRTTTPHTTSSYVDPFSANG